MGSFDSIIDTFHFEAKVIPSPTENGQERKEVRQYDLNISISLGIFVPLLIFLPGHLDYANKRQHTFQDTTCHLKRR